MAKSSTPNLVYLVNDEAGVPRRYRDVDEAVSAAARSSFNTENTASVYIYNKDHLSNDPPVGVLNVKVTFASWG